jgi:ADP-ribose pyrophosphatase YjhB (NUDIX family)
MRTRTKKPLTLEEFRSIYSRVNRLNVEIIIKTDQGFLLTLRDIEPYKNEWHIPGGTVYYREKVIDAVQRIAWEELGVEVEVEGFLGYIEYPSIAKYGNIDAPFGLAFKCRLLGTDFKLDDQSSAVKFFQQLPANIIKEQKEFLEDLDLNLTLPRN